MVLQEGEIILDGMPTVIPAAAVSIIGSVLRILTQACLAHYLPTKTKGSGSYSGGEAFTPGKWTTGLDRPLNLKHLSR